jgi:tetratricopeptide (TPR) repeat protein
VDKKPLPTKDMNGFVRATLADIAEAVNDHPRLAAPFAPGVLPQVDAAVAALARLPRPPAGDRARARDLNNQANQLMARNSDWAPIADLMAQAHAADPQDAEILNFLAYSQMQSGRHAEALKNILESLRLAPTSANGWNRLAQIRLAAAKGDARQIQEASRYYVVTYWFSRDRPRVMRYFNGELTVGLGDSPDNPAAISIALQRLPK